MKFAILCCLPGMALADPSFEPRPLPVEHVYGGGWEHFVGGGVAIFDCNGDGFEDLFLAGGENPAQLLVNESEAEIAFRPAEVAALTRVTGAYPLDINSDGHFDLAVMRVGPNVLLKGGADCQFSDATEEWGFDAGDAWSTAFSATWEAGRDWPTLAVGNYVNRSDPDGPFEACDANELHRVSDSGRYEKTALEPGFCALSMLFSDWNRSGVQDLRVSNDRHYYVSGGSEQMWAMPELSLRDGNGWKPISIWGMGIASQDLTGDGRPEVVLTSMGDQLLQIANDEGYEAAPYAVGTYAQRPFIGDDGRPSTGWHAEFGDVNNDGFADLFIAKGNVDQMPGLAMRDPNNLLMRGVDGTFVEKGDVAGVASMARSRGGGLADFNRDGLLDLVVVNRRAAAEVYQNVSEGGGWITVLPQQAAANVNAVGAWVEVRLGDRLLSREVTIGGGHMSGRAGPLHFGLGDLAEAEMRVIWPDGSATEWSGVHVGDRVVITK